MKTKTSDWVMDNLHKAIYGKKIIIAIEDQEIYEAIITEFPKKGKRPRRYEIEVPNGISINDFDQHGDNLLYAWCFPANSESEAVAEFIRRVREKREE
jgi:hypothetical protein